jgi:aspartate/methionine/tyrosine aminotransferase
MLSHRGEKKANEPLRSDLALFEKAQDDPYGSDNPDGAITLCIAENVLQWGAVRDKLQSITRQDWPDWIAAYAPLPGHPDFRAAVADFVGHYIAGCRVEADHFCAGAGATSVVEVSALCLGDPGDAVVFPAPAYQAYTSDITNKAGLERYDIREYAAEWGAAYHPLSVAELEGAYAELGDRFRMLVLTQPDNPTGLVYSGEQLESFADWCSERGVHLVVNEIYALSQFDPDRVANRSPYTSVLPLLIGRDSPYLHWWYSFSKDFGISGLRVGLVYSRNDTFRSAYANFNAPHQVSTLVQWQLSQLLTDRRWIDDFTRRNRKLLTDAYLTVTDTMDGLGVPYRHARGSLFVWADFSAFLAGGTIREWWEALFRDTGVLLTAPDGFGQLEEGWLRIVYSCVSAHALREAMGRLRNQLRG